MNEPNPKIIKEYYSKAELTLPDNPGWRTWKFKLPGGRFLHIDKRINSIEKFRKYLVRYTPVKVYHSCSFWLNPTRMRGKYKRNYKWADTLFLGMELYFDFDVMHYEKVSTFQRVLQEVSTIYEVMKTKKDYKFKKLTWSGTHGFALVYEQVQISEPNVDRRIALYKKSRKKLKEELDGYIFQTLDTSLITDIYRIYKCENTIDFGSGYQIKKVDPEKINNINIERLLSNIPNIYHTSVSQFLAMIRTNVQDSTESVCKSREGKGRAEVRPPFNFYNFVDTSVGWKGRYVPFIVLPQKHNVDRIKKIQEQYNLGDLFIFKYTTSIAYLSLKVVSWKRLVKILKAANSLNYVTFLKYRYNWIRLGSVLTGDNMVVKEPPRFGGKLEGKQVGQYSRPHLYMLNVLLNKDLEYNNLVGIAHHTIKQVKIKCHQIQ